MTILGNDTRSMTTRVETAAVNPQVCTSESAHTVDKAVALN